MQMGGVFLVVIFAALIIAGIVSGRKKKAQDNQSDT